MSDFLTHLLTRRSVPAAFLNDPGPSEEQIAQILTAATRVPDHKKLEPWRLIRFNAQACSRFGTLLAERMKAMEPDVSEERLETERMRLLRAPFVTAVIFSPKFGLNVPEWEQVLSAGAVCMNMVHAASAFGFAAQWLTEWYAFDEQVHKALGLKDGERIAGFIHIGTSSIETTDRARPDLDDIVTYWEL